MSLLPLICASVTSRESLRHRDEDDDDVTTTTATGSEPRDVINVRRSSLVMEAGKLVKREDDSNMEKVWGIFMIFYCFL